MTIAARLGVSVDKGRGKVHQQHRKGNSIRVSAPGADHVQQNADAGAANQLAARGGGRRHRVGGNEKRAQHGGTAQQVQRQRGVHAFVPAEQQRTQAQRQQHRDRNVPADDAPPQQEQTAGHKRQVHPFPAAIQPAIKGGGGANAVGGTG